MSLDIGDGEFISLLGPSGCGKSTLLMMVAGLLDITDGSITIGETVVSSPQHNVGIVFQKPVLVDWRDILGNIMLQIELRKLPVEEYLASEYVGIFNKRIVQAALNGDGGLVPAWIEGYQSDPADREIFIPHSPRCP